ncbi:MAG: polysaccharide deacetylase family protein [Nitrospirae bacterium]|nr:polysaccharide deacetylase family protein [Candidatus Manganitrophaceae bacterium]
MIPETRLPSLPPFRRWMKSALAGGAYYSGLLDLYVQFRDRCPAQNRLFMVGYHAVVESAEEAAEAGMMPQQLMSRALFEKEIDQIGSHFDFLSIDQAVEFVEGKRQLKRDSVVVTFDDGYKGIYDHAYPILKRKGVPAIFYLCTDYVGTSRHFDHDRLFFLIHKAMQESLPIEAVLRQRITMNPTVPIRGTSPLEITREVLEHYWKEELTALVALLQEKLCLGEEGFPADAMMVSWEEVDAMAREGMHFGSHTASHCLLTEVEPTAALEELRRSKETLETRLGIKTVHLAYPDGRVNASVAEAAQACGYRSACTTAHRVNKIGLSPYLLGRELLWENSAWGWSSKCSKAMIVSQIKGLFKIGQDKKYPISNYF